MSFSRQYYQLAAECIYEGIHLTISRKRTQQLLKDGITDDIELEELIELFTRGIAGSFVSRFQDTNCNFSSIKFIQKALGR